MTPYVTEILIPTLLLGFAAALLHSMFQLGVSVLTLLSGHSLGAKKAHMRLMHLNNGYIFGVFCAVLLLCLGLITISNLLSTVDMEAQWSIVASACAVIGVVVVAKYYRAGKGTLLWVPRGIAEYLSERAKKTKRATEAFALGAMTVVAELPFIIAPLLLISLLVRQLGSEQQVLYVAAYSALVVLPLVLVAALVGSGERISAVQRWREENKLFLQYSAGLGLVIVSIYAFVFEVVGVTA